MSVPHGAGTHALSLLNYREMNRAKRDVCLHKAGLLSRANRCAIGVRLTAVVFALPMMAASA